MKAKSFFLVFLIVFLLLNLSVGTVETVGAVETRYLANQEWEAGLYNLSMSQTASGVGVTIAETQESTWTMYLGIKPYVILANNTKWSMTSNAVVAIASKLISTSAVWTVSATWTHDQINQSGIGVEVEVYVDKDTNPPTTLRKTFRTENMTFDYVTSNTWTVYYAGQTVRAGVSPNYVYSGYWRFGHATGYNSYIAGFEVDTYDFQAPIIQDFYINNTWAEQPCQYAFNITDNKALSFGVFGCNVTGTFVNDTAQTLSGTQAWFNVTKTLPSAAATVAFQASANDTNNNWTTTGIRYMKTYIWQADSTETRYMRGDNQTVHFLNANILNATQGTTTGYVEFEKSESYSYWCLDLIELKPDGSEKVWLESDVAEVQATYSTAGQLFNASWSRSSPFTFNDAYSSIVVKVKGDNFANPTTIRAVFVTEVPNAYKLENTTWTVRYWVQTIDNEAPNPDYWRFSWGNSTVTSRIENFTLSYWHRSYQALIDALKDISASAVWDDAKYAATIFDQKSKADLASMIDAYAASADWSNVLKWSAVCWKLGVERPQAIKWALGNYTMVGNLPKGAVEGGKNVFQTEYRWTLYGFYWAVEYNQNLTQWNITAAYQQWNSTVYAHGKPVLYVNETHAWGYSQRYYDEGACTISCYTIFAKLLNVTGALDDANYWWTWINVHHWYNVYYTYTADLSSYTAYEVSAPFFLRIIGILEYYKSLGNWSRILADIDNRFLSDRWDSKQWIARVNLQTEEEYRTYQDIHQYVGNPQRRFEGTFAAWLTFLGVYSKLNETTAQPKVKDMLFGYNGLEPAWSLILRPEGLIYIPSSKVFKWQSGSAVSNEATVYALGLMFMLGIVPETTTVAFPLEEIDYEYVNDIDMDCFRINLTTRKVKVAVAGNGAISFQYGMSYVTQNFSQGSGVYELTFSNSWNMITSVSRIGDLPSGRIYYQSIRNFLNFYGSAALTFATNMLKAVTFNLFGSAILTFGTNILRAISFNRYGTATLTFAALGTYYQSIVNYLNFYGSASLTFATNILRAISLNRYGTATLTFTPNGVATVVSAKILNLFGSATLTFAMNIQKIISFYREGSATLTFTPQGTYAQTIIGNFLTFCGSATLNFATNIGRIITFYRQGTATLTFTPEAITQFLQYGVLRLYGSAVLQFLVETTISGVVTAIEISIPSAGFAIIAIVVAFAALALILQMRQQVGED